MSHAEKRNVAILVVVGCVLLAGVTLLANYSGILRADAQEQPKVGCGGEGKVCTGSVAATGAAGLATVHASVDEAPAGGCCSAEKAATCSDETGGCSGKVAGCCEAKPTACSDETGGCTGNVAGCCEAKPAGCCEVPPAGCCGKPKDGVCCSAEAEGTI